MTGERRRDTLLTFTNKLKAFYKSLGTNKASDGFIGVFGRFGLFFYMEESSAIILLLTTLNIEVILLLKSPNWPVIALLT